MIRAMQLKDQIPTGRSKRNMTDFTARIAAPHVGLTDEKEACDVAVIVPFYKGAVFVSELVDRTHQALEKQGLSFQLVLVDDRSPGNDWTEIEAVAAADSRVVGIRLSRNFGQHAAISAGIAYAQARWYVVMDCDLQDPPEQIPALYQHAVDNQLDVVIAERSASGHGRRRSYGSRLFYGMFRWVSGLEVSSEIGNFRLFSHKVADAYRAYPEQLRLFPAIMAQVGFATGSIRVPRSTRPEGKSSYTYLKLASLALEAIIAYSERPLWWIAGLGLAVCLGALVFGFVIMIQYAIGVIEVAGFATLAILTTFLGGAHLFVISVVGLYVGRVLAEAKHRPIFIVDEIARKD
ncbi:dolichol-phosphate mannosyltransferase [Roseovarius litoreus]|uniref:Dolichol-phosphate mannosyltransferase n=2 Tax=Roseovarius litoreus TaxID=1155722 RepID=A0A1M7A0F5_9RHOB|nr:dolichol-phosphate mannosyltransferase [Roseovarius litoreus]